MEEKKSFLMFYDWEPLFLMLDSEDLGDLIKALYAFEIRNEVPEADSLNPSAWGLFNYLSGIFDENRKKWLQKQTAGQRGGKKSAEVRKTKTENNQEPSTSQAEVKQTSSTSQAEVKQNQPKVKDKVKDKEENKEILSKESTKKSTAFSLSRFDDELLLFPEFPDDPEVKQMFKEFIEMRNAKGKANAVNTMATFKGLVKTLLTKSEGDIETMKAMIEYSTVRGYQTFYDPKENKTITQQKTKAQVNDLDAAFERVFGKGAK